MAYGAPSKYKCPSNARNLNRTASSVPSKIKFVDVVLVEDKGWPEQELAAVD